jgi:uncharacterized membrane protein
MDEEEEKRTTMARYYAIARYGDRPDGGGERFAEAMKVLEDWGKRHEDGGRAAGRWRIVAAAVVIAAVALWLAFG